MDSSRRDSNVSMNSDSDISIASSTTIGSSNSVPQTTAEKTGEPTEQDKITANALKDDGNRLFSGK